MPLLLAIMGPTAVGKSRVGLELARRLGGEIISADSMMVYRYMDIGTAKPTLAERALVRHHLIDVVDPDEPFSVADYQALAVAAVRDAVERGRIPVLVGGTGLYIRALLEGYEFVEIPTDWEFRKRMRVLAASRGPHFLYERLREVDPPTAAKVHPHDLRRVIRALEVYERTGRRLSSFGAAGEGLAGMRVVKIGLTAPRDCLYRRIDERVDAQIAAGLVDEVKGLLAMGYHESLFSMQGLGYRHMLGYLLGRYPLEHGTETMKRDTRRFAKRQLTWFRREEGIIWLGVGEHTDVARKVEEISNIVAGEDSQA